MTRGAGVLSHHRGLSAERLPGTLEVEPEDVRRQLVGSLAPGRKGTPQEVPFTPLAKKARELTTREALELRYNNVGCEHLLFGLPATEDGLASRVLRRMGVELRTTRRAVVTALSGFVHARQHHVSHPSTLEEILRRLEAIERRLAG